MTDRIAANYPILAAFQRSTLGAMIQERADRYLADNPKLSPNRAAEIAAAALWLWAIDERDQLDGDVMEDPTLESFWEDVEYRTPTIQHVLVDLTGSRTLLDDLELLRLGHDLAHPPETDESRLTTLESPYRVIPLR